MRMGNVEKYFTKETTTNNWYKVKFKWQYLIRSLFCSRNTDLKLVQIDFKQRKGEDNLCYGQGRWQNQLVAEVNFKCLTYDSGVGLYIAGNYFGLVFDGQVRNFAYVQK